MSELAEDGQDGWILEGVQGDGRLTWRSELVHLPFVIGRLEGCDLSLPEAGVSGRHAEIVARRDGIALRDLGSKNGTFVNHDRVRGEAALASGDVIHIANREFRLLKSDRRSARTATVALDLGKLDTARQIALKKDAFVVMLNEHRLGNFYQPVVELQTGEYRGFEALGRGNDPELPQGPEQLFEMAESYDLARQLCRTLRSEVVSEASELPAGSQVFLNTHPHELDDLDDLLRGLEVIRNAMAGLPLVLELHEMAVTESRGLRPFRDSLRDLEIDVAFDDFGKGRDRILELAELSPDYLKFDRRLIAGLAGEDVDREARIRRSMLKTIISMMTEFDVATIAEGVETENEVRICRDLGFDFGQGYFWGRPAEAQSWR